MNSSKTKRSAVTKSRLTLEIIDGVIESSKTVTVNRGILSHIIQRLNRIKVSLKKNDIIDEQTAERIFIEINQSCVAIQDFINQQNSASEACKKNNVNIPNKHREAFLHNMFSRLVKHEVDLTGDHSMKIQIYSEALIEQRILKQQALSDEIEKRIADAGKKMKADAQMQLAHLKEKHSRVIKPYLERCLELYEKVSINGLEIGAVSRVAKNYYQISDRHREKFERGWIKPCMPVKYMPIQLRIDSSTSFERRAARQMVMADHDHQIASLSVGAPVGTWRQRLLAAPYMPSMVERDRLNNESEKTTEIKDVLREHRWIVILGDPGCGKTSFVQWLCTSYVHVAQMNQDELSFGPFRMPIVIRIGEFADAVRKKPDLTLFDHIGKHKWFGKPMYTVREDDKVYGKNLATSLQEYVGQGHALIILDGLDEIFVSDERMRLVNLVETFADTYVQTSSFHSALDDLPFDIVDKPARFGGNQLIITSRIVGYHAAPLSGRFAHYRIMAMDLDHINSFVDNWFTEVHAEVIRVIKKTKGSVNNLENKWKEQADHLKVELANPTQTGLQELCSNACLLSFICSIAFSSQGSSLPSQRILLYEKTVNAMLDSWKNKDTNDTTIHGSKVIWIFCDIASYIHTHSAAGLIEETKLKEICIQSLHSYEGKKVVTTQDMARVEKDAADFVEIVRKDVGVLAERGESFYGFLHLTFQEYFVCLDLINITKLKRHGIPEQRSPPTDTQRLARSLNHHISDPRFRVPIALAFGRLSSKWKNRSDALDSLCSEFLSMDSSSFFPVSASFLLHCFNDFIQQPSANILIEALNQLLISAAQQKWYLNNPTLHLQMKSAVKKLPDHVINQWISFVLSHRKRPSVHTVSTLCSIIANDDRNSLEIAAIDASTHKLLTCFLEDDSESNNFMIDTTLVKIAFVNHHLLPVASNSLKAYLIREGVDENQIHPSIMAMIIIFYGGLKREENKVTFDPLRMHRESEFLTPFLIEYLRTKGIPHAKKIVQLEKECTKILSAEANKSKLASVVDAIIAMLCMFGIHKLWTFSSLSLPVAFSMALSRLKHISMILRQLYICSESKVAADLVTNNVNDYLRNQSEVKSRNEHSFANNVVLYIRAITNALARLRCSSRRFLVLDESAEEELDTFTLPALFQDEAILEQLLSKNGLTSSEQLSHSILPDFVRLFWILEDDKKTDTQYRMAVAADTIPRLLLLKNDIDPMFGLTFIPDHLRTLYRHLLNQHDILMNDKMSDKTQKKVFLLFQHVLVQCLTELSSSSCNLVSSAFSLCAILPLLRKYKLDAIATALSSRLNKDNDCVAMIEYTRQRPVDLNTGQYTDEFKGTLHIPDNFETEFSLQETIAKCIKDERLRIQTGLRLLQDKDRSLEANSQLYSASVSLSYISCFYNDIDSFSLFLEATDAAVSITLPLLRFDAFCIIAWNGRKYLHTAKLKSNLSLKVRLERDVPSITTDLRCTLHAAILLRCIPLNLDSDVIEASLRDLLKKTSKADALDQLCINRALFGSIRSHPLVRSHLLKFLQEPKFPPSGLAIDLFQTNSSVFLRSFTNTNASDVASKDVSLTLQSSMFIVELTSDINCILEWLDFDISKPTNTLFSKQPQSYLLTKPSISEVLTWSQVLLIDNLLRTQSRPQSTENNSKLHEINLELHFASTVEPTAQKLVEGWLDFERNSILYPFACHGALLLLKSNVWTPKAVDIVCDLLLFEEDRFRQRAEMIFKLSNDDDIQKSSQLTMEIVLKLVERGLLFRRTSPYATLMLIRKQEHLEIDQQSHLNALLFLEKERILTVDKKHASVDNLPLSPFLLEQFRIFKSKKLLNFSFLTWLARFSPSIIQYTCRLIESNFANVFDNLSLESQQEFSIKELFVERALTALPMNKTNRQIDTSSLVSTLSALLNNSTSHIIQRAAVYALGFSTAENALPTLYAIIENITSKIVNNSHGYSDEYIGSAVRSYCYCASNTDPDIVSNGEIKVLHKLLNHSSAIISKATRYGLGRVLDTEKLMEILQSNYIQCYEALLGGTADQVLSSASERCVEATAALLEQHPDLLAIFVQELYEHIRYFTNDIHYDTTTTFMYEYNYPHYVDVAALVAQRMPAAFCNCVNEFVDGEKLKRFLYYTSKQHDFPRRAACLTVLSMFGELTADLCEMLIQALLDDPYIQNTCYRCLSRIRSIKDVEAISKLKNYLKSRSMNARYVACRLLIHLSTTTHVVSLEEARKLLDEVICDPTSTEFLWLVVEQEGTNAQSVYYNAGQLKNVVFALLTKHLLGDIDIGEATLDKETNDQSLQHRDFIESEKIARLAACSIEHTDEATSSLLSSASSLLSSASSLSSAAADFKQVWFTGDDNETTTDQ